MLKQAGDQAVARRRPVDADEALRTGRLRRLGQVVADRFFDLAVEHPAAHQPAVDFPVVGAPVADQRTDHAVVTKAVEQADLQGEGVRRTLHLGDLGLGVTARGEVELVGLVDQLRDALAALRLERRKLDMHLQRAQELAQVARARLQLAALGIAPVLVGPGQVFGCEGDRLKITRQQQSAGKTRGVVAQLGHSHLGQRLAYLRTLRRVVVEQDQRIQADVEALGNAFEVRGLVLPVGNKDGDVVFFEQHAGVLLKRQPGGGLVVLRAHRQHNATPAQIQRHRLHSAVRLAPGIPRVQRDAFKAVVADHAAPEGVVQVQHQAFARLAAHRRQGAQHAICVERQRVSAKRQLGQSPVAVVVPLIQAHGLGQRIDVDQHVSAGRYRLRQAAVESRHR